MPDEELATLAPFGNGLPRPSLIATLTQGDGPTVHLNGHYDVVPGRQRLDARPVRRRAGRRLDLRPRRRRHEERAGGAGDRGRGAAARRLRRHDRAERGARRGDRRRAQRRHGLAGRAGPDRGRRADHHRAVRPRRRRDRPQGRDLGRDHAARQAGPRLLARGSASTPSRRWRATWRRWTRTLRPQLEQRVTDYGVTPDEPRSTLSFDTIRGGAATNIVPDRCTVTFNRRLIPGEDLDTRARGAARAAGGPALRLPARPTPPNRCWWARRSLWCRPPAAPSATSAWSRGS